MFDMHVLCVVWNAFLEGGKDTLCVIHILSNGEFVLAFL